MRRLTMVVLMQLAVSICGLAQSPTATLSGRVLDPSEAAVPGAHVDAINIGTNAASHTTTNGEGFYTIVNLPPGSYRVEVTKPGFKALIKPEVVLHVQDMIAINFKLSLGAVSESITVRGGAPLVQTESGSVSTVIDRKLVESLPLNGRSFNTLLQLTPGAVIAPSDNGLNPGQFSMSGQRTNTNSFQIDGVGANFGVAGGFFLSRNGAGGVPAFNAYGGTSSLVSVDAVEEFRVETSSFAPEYGRTPGGQIIINTRSGANQWHGGLFDYFRNDKLDANNWFNGYTNNPPIPKAEERQNDFGGILGGPIVRDKTFFFFSYEGLRLRQPQTQTIVVPSVQVRQSAVAAAHPYLNAYPQPNGPVSADGNTAQFIGAFSNGTGQDATSIRIDQVFGSKATVFGRYNHAPSNLHTRATSLSTTQVSNVGTDTLTVGATFRIRPSLTSSIRGNYSVQDAGGSASLDSFGGAVPLDDAALFPSGVSPTNSSGHFNPSDGTISLDVGSTGRNREAQLNLVSDATWVVGFHQVKFGADYRDLYLDSRGLAAGLNYFVSDVGSFAGTDQADFVLNSVVHRARMLLRSVSVYGQDAWKVKPRLTLTYGVRWEFNPAPSGRDGTTFSAWNNIEDPARTSLAAPGTALWETTLNNFAPRLGVAYAITEKGDFVVRGGIGLFYDLGTGIAPALTTAFPNSAQAIAFGLTLPLNSLAPVTPIFSLSPPFGGSVVGIARNLKLPRSYQWNVATEKSFWGKQTISVTYVGQVGRRLLRNVVEFQPNPDFEGNTFTAVINGDSSDYHALQLQYRRALSKGLQTLVNYSWSHSIDTNSTESFSAVPDGVSPASVDRGSSDFDVRQNFSAAATYAVPRFGSKGGLARIANDWSIEAVAQARSGFPINVVTLSTPVPVLGMVGIFRPDVVSGQPFWIRQSGAPGGKHLNLAAFAAVNEPRQGTLGRNAIAGFGLAQLDLSIARTFHLSEKVQLLSRVDSFNVLNHPNFANPSLANFRTVIEGDPQFFGYASQMANVGLGGLSALYQIGGPRSLQLSLKLTF